MRPFLLTLLAVLVFLAIPLAVKAEPPPITRYAKIGWIGYYDQSGQRVTWLHADEVQAKPPPMTEIIKVDCQVCQGRGFTYVQNAQDFCGVCNGNGTVKVELVNVMPVRDRDLLVRFDDPKPHSPTPPCPNCQCGCTVTGKCNCKDCDHPLLEKPAVKLTTIAGTSKPTKLYPAGYYWERLDNEEWGLRYDGKQVGGYRIADKTYLPFDGENWGTKCQPPTDLPGAPQRIMQQSYLPAWGTTPGCSTGR